MHRNQQTGHHQRILEAASAIRAGRFDDAIALLAPATGEQHHGCAVWNLLGVAHECRRDWRQARRCYGKAIAADGQFSAAQQNMRRLYELDNFGHSTEAIALGDSEIPFRLETSLTKEPPVPTPN